MTDLEAQAMVALDAIEAGHPRATALLVPIRARVSAHGLREGRKDYAHRGRNFSTAWQGLHGRADEAYLDAIGSDAIMRAIGLPKRLWDHVSDTWHRAFKRGYSAAQDAAAASKPKKSVAQLDREINAVLNTPRRRRRR